MRIFLQLLLSEQLSGFASNDELKKLDPKTGKNSIKGPSGSGDMIGMPVTKLTNRNE